MLEQALGLPQVSTGDLFRHNLKHNTELGKLARSYMDKGKLVPDEVTVAMAKERLSRPDAAEGVILDGFPRTRAQAVALERLIDEFGSRIAVVPHIKVDEEELVSRLMKRAEVEGRADDNEETIRTRMRVYDEQTKPLLDYYEEQGLLVEVDGEQSIEAVQADLQSVIRSAVESGEWRVESG
jgi:adenylate kinase